MNARQDAYAAYMASQEWAERKRALFKASTRCHCCNRKHSARRPLDAHHLTYANFGDELPSELVLVCRICHDLIHHGAFENTGSLSQATEMVRQLRSGTNRTSAPPEWRAHALKTKIAANRWHKARRRKPTVD